MTWDWDAGPRRPFTKKDVWTLLKAGCNANEIAAAAGVSLPVALGMINEAVPKAKHKPGELHLKKAA